MLVRASQFPPPRAALPLGLALGLHLLLVLAWLGRSPPRLPDAESGAVSVLIPVLVPLPRPRLEPAAPASKRAPPPPRRGSAAPAPPQAPASPAPEPAQEAPAPEPFVGAAPSPPSLSGDSELLGRAKRAAGPIDRALRGGKSEVPAEPDTPWARFRRGLEAAHVPPMLSETRDRYTSPDGIVVYRSRQGRRETCRQTGSVNFLPGGAKSAGSAGEVPCPRGVTWERY